MAFSLPYKPLNNLWTYIQPLKRFGVLPNFLKPLGWSENVGYIGLGIRRSLDQVRMMYTS